jgi:hypothetical protein
VAANYFDIDVSKSSASVAANVKSFANKAEREAASAKVYYGLADVIKTEAAKREIYKDEISTDIASAKGEIEEGAKALDKAQTKLDQNDIARRNEQPALTAWFSDVKNLGDVAVSAGDASLVKAKSVSESRQSADSALTAFAAKPDGDTLGHLISAEKNWGDSAQAAAKAAGDAAMKANNAAGMLTTSGSSPLLAALTLIAFGYVAADAMPLGKKIADLLKKMAAALLPKSGASQSSPPAPQRVAGGSR